MSNSQERSSKSRQDRNEQSFDLKSLIYMALRHWHIFFLCVIIALAVGWAFNRLKAPEYQVNGTLLIKDQKTNFDPTAIMTGVAYGNSQILDNEIAVLQSFNLREKAVKKMNMEVMYFDNSGLIINEMYKTSPFTIEFDKQIPQAVDLLYTVVIDGEQVTLSAEANMISQYDYSTEEFVTTTPIGPISINGTYPVGEWIDTGYNRFRIEKNAFFVPETDNGRKMSFVFKDYLTLAQTMQFSAAAISKQASIIRISMIGKNREKCVEFINTLMNEYVNRGLDKKNQVSQNTIVFIDQQLEETESSLSQAENELQEFRTKHDLTNLNEQSRQMINSLQDLEKQHASLLVNYQYFKRLQNYIQTNIDNPDNLAAPSALGISDPLLNKLVQDLVNLNQQRTMQLLTYTDQHPVIAKIDEQIVTTKKTLLENVNNLVDNTRINLNDIESRIKKVENETRNLPQKERLLVGYQRKFTLNQETYNYLMQRRAEAQIIKASNTADNEILDVADYQRAVLVAPRKMMNYLVAIIIGLLIPTIFLFLKDYFNVKIRERKDVEKLTDFPIIGQIGQTKSKSPTVVIEKPKSPISEAFRSIRTNLDFITQGKEQSTILVTGDMQSVGKTFNSINIASIYAMYGKKTVLLGFDLRKPKLYQEFNISNNIGLSSYLSNKNELDEVIQNSGKLDSWTSSPPARSRPTRLSLSLPTKPQSCSVCSRKDMTTSSSTPRLWAL